MVIDERSLPGIERIRLSFAVSFIISLDLSPPNKISASFFENVAGILLMMSAQ